MGWEGGWTGVEALVLSLPGPPSPPCHSNFSEANFRSVDIAWEVWFRRSTVGAVEEFPGASSHSRTRMFRMLNKSMKSESGHMALWCGE